MDLHFEISIYIIVRGHTGYASPLVNVGSKASSSYHWHWAGENGGFRPIRSSFSFHTIFRYILEMVVDMSKDKLDL